VPTSKAVVSEWDKWIVTDPRLQMKDDLLSWWREHERDFPIIARIARSHLGVPATSCPSERVFSAAGNILSSKRCSMTPRLLRDSVLCYENRHLVPSCADIAKIEGRQKFSKKISNVVRER